MTQKNYKKVFHRVHSAAKKVADESMKKAANELKEAENQELADCSVSFDGTWQRRGHASHHGVVTAVSVDTGKCVDVEVLSNICKGCSHWESKDKSSLAYTQWKQIVRAVIT